MGFPFRTCLPPALVELLLSWDYPFQVILGEKYTFNRKQYGSHLYLEGVLSPDSPARNSDWES